MDTSLIYCTCLDTKHWTYLADVAIQCSVVIGCHAVEQKRRLQQLYKAKNFMLIINISLQSSWLFEGNTPLSHVMWLKVSNDENITCSLCIVTNWELTYFSVCVRTLRLKLVLMSLSETDKQQNCVARPLESRAPLFDIQATTFNIRENEWSSLALLWGFIVCKTVKTIWNV